MLKLPMCVFIVVSLILCPHNVDRFGDINSSVGGAGGLVAATNGHDSPLEGRDRHHHERGGHIRRDINHCWRRYDGYNLQNTYVNKREQLKKPYGILCNFKCTWFFTVNFPTCEFIYDYKLSCYLFTSLSDCTSVKCTLLNFFS